jgi:hypothetical protein
MSGSQQMQAPPENDNHNNEQSELQIQVVMTINCASSGTYAVVEVCSRSSDES